MGHVVHREPVRRNYYATLCSCAFFISVCLTTLAFVLPLVAAWTSDHFWIKQKTYREQPKMTFKKKMMIILQTKDSAQNDGVSTLSWCTNEYGNEIMSSSIRVPVVREMEKDDDRDGSTDTMELNVRVPLKRTEAVHGVWFIALYRYRLTEHVDVEWEAAAIVDERTPLDSEALVVDGDFYIRQRDLFTSADETSALYSDEVMLEGGQYASIDDFLPQNMVQNYSARTFSTTFDYRYPVWVPRTKEVPVDRTFTHFDFNVTLRVPTDTITYRPGFGETIKFGIIQYVAFYVVIAPLVTIVQNFIFRNQIVESKVVVEVPIGSRKPHNF